MAHLDASLGVNTLGQENASSVEEGLAGRFKDDALTQAGHELACTLRRDDNLDHDNLIFAPAQLDLVDPVKD